MLVFFKIIVYNCYVNILTKMTLFLKGEAHIMTTTVHISTGFITVRRENLDLLDPYESIYKKIKESIEKNIPKGSKILDITTSIKYEESIWNVIYKFSYV